MSPYVRAEINKKRAIALRKRAALKSVGASSWKEVEKWVSVNGGSKSRLRPSLQVCPYTWATNQEPIKVGAAGGVYLFSSYTYGNGDYQRHTNETMTYKMQLVIPDEYKTFVGKWPVYMWLIYDKSPNGTMPEMKTILTWIIVIGLW